MREGLRLVLVLRVGGEGRRRGGSVRDGGGVVTLGGGGLLGVGLSWRELGCKEERSETTSSRWL